MNCDTWTPVPMYCPNCGHLNIGYRNDENKIRYECQRCKVVFVRVPKGRRHDISQQKLFLEYLRKEPVYLHWYPVFYIMCNTGMRVGEITGLRWRDIDLEQGLISVNHTLVYYNHRDEKGCYFSINTPKTKAGERVIPMTEGVTTTFLLPSRMWLPNGLTGIYHCVQIWLQRLQTKRCGGDVAKVMNGIH